MMIAPILSIIDSGLKLFSSERATRFKTKYHNLLTALRESEDKVYPDYTDYDVDNQQLLIEALLQAFDSEIREHVLEDMQQKV